MSPIAEVASAFVSLMPSAKGFGSKLDSQIGGEIQSSGKKSGKLFGAAMLGVAGAVIGGAVALGGFLKGSLSEARDAQKVGALTNAVIKSTGGVANVTAKQVDSLATSISLKTGVDDEAIASGQNMLLTFGNVRNEIGKGNDIFTQATVAATDMAAAFGGDAVSNSKMLGKALNDPTAGVSALTRVGVSFTAQQKEQIKTLQASGDTLGAQKVILKELSKQTAGAAESQASAGDKAKVAFGNLQETVGTALLPLWDKAMVKGTEFLLFLTANIGPAFSAVGAFIAPIKTAIEGLFASGGGGSGLMSTVTGLASSIQASLLPVILSAADTFQNVILPAVLALASSIQANFLPVLETTATMFATVVLPAIVAVASYLLANLVPIFQQVAGIITTQVVPIIATLVGFFYGQLYPAIVKIVAAIAVQLKPVFDQLFKSIQGQILPAVSKLLAKFKQWWPTIQKVIMVVLKVVGALLVLAAAILGKVLPPIIKFVAWLIGKLVGAIGTVIGWIVTFIGWVIDIGGAFVKAVAFVLKFQTGVMKIIGKVIGFVAGIPGKIMSALGGLASLLFNAGQELIQGLIDGITAKLSALVAKMKEVADKVKGFLPGSPVREGPLRSWNNGGAGKALIGLLADGLGQTSPIDRAMGNLTRRVNVPHLGLDDVSGRSSAGSARDGGVSLATLEALFNGMQMRVTGLEAGRGAYLITGGR